MRALLPSAFLLALAVALVPTVLAQDEPKADRPDDAAWYQDCPTDAMCAAASPPVDEPARGEEDEGCDPTICAFEPPASAERNPVPGASVAAALGILAVASLGVALLPRA